MFGPQIVICKDVPSTNFVIIYYTLLMILRGIVVSWIDIPASVLLQKVVPENILGRVISVKLSIIKLIVPIKLMISGYFLEKISPFYILMIGSLVFLLFNIWFFILRNKCEYSKLSEIKLLENLQ
jgi:hypothetical protein